MKTEKQSETTKSPFNWRDEVNAEDEVNVKVEPIYDIPDDFDWDKFDEENGLERLA